MKLIIKRVAKVTAAATLLACLAVLAIYAFTPTPQSPSLVNQAGVRLDDASKAKLTELVIQAARENDAATVDAYLREGFTPNVRSERGDTLLTVAAYYNSTEIVRLLLGHPETDLEARNRMGLTAVAAAAFKGHDDSLRALLNAGADPNGSNGLGQTALMFASLAGRTSSVELLDAAGADTNQTDEFGNSALDVALSQGADPVVSYLSTGEMASESDAPAPIELQ